jgi:hypothetical protein
MYPDILSAEQKQLLPFFQKFKDEFYLVGGTAIALQLGHRRSIDFDLFKPTSFVSKKIVNKFSLSGHQYEVTLRLPHQLNIMVLGVRATFYEFPYDIMTPIDFKGVFRMPDLLTLAAMKAFAFGRRSKWKDYVDMYFLLRDKFNFEQISVRAYELFGEEFSQKLFAAQLSYFDDIDYREQLMFLSGKEVSENEIKGFLTDQTLVSEKIKNLTGILR